MTANEITSSLIIEICRRWPNRARCWRNNTGVGIYGDRRVPFGVPGQADITGIIDGRRLEIEVKAGRDRLSEAQQRFAAMIAGMGGIYLVARDVDGCLAEIEREITR